MLRRNFVEDVAGADPVDGIRWKRGLFRKALTKLKIGKVVAGVFQQIGRGVDADDLVDSCNAQGLGGIAGTTPNVQGTDTSV